MAAGDSGSLGSLSVQITGDYSQLIQAINDAQGAATAGSQSIVDAVNTAGTAADQASGKFGEMAEALAGIGEALAITEGLKEFGEEALNAYGTVQSVTIGLTQLTGSAEDANDIIEQVKQLAATEPFAFPEIAPTVQRMVALGVSSAQIPQVMQAAANAAAATGNSFDTVANSIDRISLSGTVSSRTLTQLGVSTQQLGDIMGVSATAVTAAFKALDQTQRIDILLEAMTKFSGAAEAQAQGISGAWQIFQNQFEEVMVGVGQALAPVVADIIKFGETVLAEAQSAINWFNQLPNPIKDTAVAIGIAVAAIAPLTAGLGALVLGVSALSSLLPAGIELLTTLGIVASTTAAEETTAAVATEALAAATATAGEGAVAAGAGFAGFGLTLGPVAAGIAAVVAAVAIANFTGVTQELKDLGAAVTEQGGPWDAFKAEVTEATDEISSGASLAFEAIPQALGLITSALGTTHGPLQTLSADFQQAGGFSAAAAIALQSFGERLLGIPVNISTITVALKAFGEANQDSATNQMALMNKALASMLGGLTPLPPAFGNSTISVAGFSAGLQALVTKQQAANLAVSQAKQALADAKAALDAGTISQGTYNLALLAYDKAVLAATPHGKDFADSVAGITQQMTLAQEKATSSETVYANLNKQFDNGTTSLGTLAEAYKKAQTAATNAGQAFATAAGQMALIDQGNAKLQATYDADTQALANYETKLQSGNLTAQQQAQVTQNIITLYGTLQGDAVKLGTSFYDATAAMLSLTAGATKQQDALNDVANTYTSLAGLGEKTVTQQQDLNAAFKQVTTDAAAMGISVQKVGDGLLFTATNANTATPQIKAYADQLTQLYSGSVDFVTVNGKVTATLQSIADIARNDTIPAIHDVTVTAAQAGAAIGQVGQAALQAGENFDVSGVKVTNFKEATQAVNTTLQGLQTAANNADQGVLALSGDAGHYYTLTQVGTSTVITFTDALNKQATALKNVAGAASSATASIASLDSAMQTYNSLQAKLEGTGAGPETESLSQLASIYNPFNNAGGGPVGVQSITTGGVFTGSGVSGLSSPLQQYQDQMAAQAQALIQEGYTIQSISLALSQAESTYSDTIDTSTLVMKSAASATTTTTAAVTSLGTAATTAAAAVSTVNDDLATSDDAYGALNDALNTAGLSYASLSEAQQQAIEQNLQAAAAGGTTVSALDELATTLVTASQSASTAVDTLGTSAATAATTIAQAATTVSNAAVAVAATAISVLASVPGANALASGITSSTGLNFTGLTLAPSTPGTGGLVGIITPGTGQQTSVGGSQPLAVTLQNTGMIVGTNGMQQLAQLLMPQIVTALRQAGAKV